MGTKYHRFIVQNFLKIQTAECRGLLVCFVITMIYFYLLTFFQHKRWPFILSTMVHPSWSACAVHLLPSGLISVSGDREGELLQLATTMWGAAGFDAFSFNTYRRLWMSSSITMGWHIIRMLVIPNYIYPPWKIKWYHDHLILVPGTWAMGITPLEELFLPKM